jgi:hypothetical protein
VEESSQTSANESSQLVGTWNCKVTQVGGWVKGEITYRADGTYTETSKGKLFYEKQVRQGTCHGRFTSRGGILTYYGPDGVTVRDKFSIEWVGPNQIVLTCRFSQRPDNVGVRIPLVRAP